MVFNMPGNAVLTLPRGSVSEAMAVELLAAANVVADPCSIAQRSNVTIMGSSALSSEFLAGQLRVTLTQLIWGGEHQMPQLDPVRGALRTEQHT